MGFVIILDAFDRGQYYSIGRPEDEFREFFMYKTTEEQERAFSRNFGNLKYRFPREEVAEVKLIENRFLMSRLTSRRLSEVSKAEVISFFNNPANFDWSKTTWQDIESEYILRFYSADEKEIGKIWLCIDDCGATKSIPFSPNMKYGGLSETGKENIERILKSILKG